MKIDWKKYFGKKKVPEPYSYPAKPSCDAVHMKPLLISSGQLFGFPGKVHAENLKDLNIFLLDTYVPFGVYSNYGLSTKKKDPKIIYMPIDDRKIPYSPKAFYQVLREAVKILDKGGSVAVSCFGGHGRTGMVIASLYSYFNPDCKQPLEKIRELGCSRWIETVEQAAFVYKISGLEFDFDHYYKLFGGKYESKTASHAKGNPLDTHTWGEDWESSFYPYAG